MILDVVDQKEEGQFAGENELSLCARVWEWERDGISLPGGTAAMR